MGRWQDGKDGLYTTIESGRARALFIIIITNTKLGKFGKLRYTGASGRHEGNELYELGHRNCNLSEQLKICFIPHGTYAHMDIYIVRSNDFGAFRVDFHPLSLYILQRLWKVTRIRTLILRIRTWFVLQTPGALRSFFHPRLYFLGNFPASVSAATRGTRRMVGIPAELGRE